MEGTRVGGGLPRTFEHIERLRDRSMRGEIIDGVQLCVLRGDRVIADESVGHDGLGRELPRTSLGQVRCCVAKPLVALTIASLVADGRCAWDTHVGAVLDGPFHPRVAACTIDDLLCHRGGLHQTPAAMLGVGSPADRLAHAMSSPPPDGWRRGTDSSYDETCGSLLLGAAIEELTGLPYEEVVAERVLGPAGLDACNVIFRMSEDFFDAHHDLIGVSSSDAGGRQIAHLTEACRDLATEWNPSWNAFATARGLARLFKYHLDLVDGLATNEFLPIAVVEELLVPPHEEPRRHRPPDPIVLGRGVQHHLRSIGVPRRFATDTFGHFGNGVAVAFADRELGMAVGLRFTRRVPHTVHLARTGRLVSALYADLTGDDASRL